MATGITILCRFTDGSFASLVNDDVTAGFTGEECKTGGTGLAQTSGISLGQAYANKQLSHCMGIVSTQNSAAGSGLWGQIRNAQGTIVGVFPVGGQHMTDFYRLPRPISMKPGVVAWAAWQASSDSATLVAALQVLCSDGTCDVFGATMVDSTKTELVNKEGASIGQSLTSKTIVRAWGSYGGTLGISNQQGGNNFLYHERSDGQLAALYPAGDGSPNLTNWSIPTTFPVRVLQNDSVFGMSDT
jgi:hypothetical protein